jgi:hypothetical protein
MTLCKTEKLYKIWRPFYLQNQNNKKGEKLSSITCPECGTMNTPDSVFCAACGASLATATPKPTETTTAPPPPPPSTTVPPPAPTVSPVERPQGVTILGVLAVVAAILQIITGLILAALTDSGGFIVLFLIIGIFYFITGWGLLNLKKWSWYIALILALIGLIGIPIGTIISIIVLWYLFKTKSYFGL